MFMIADDVRNGVTSHRVRDRPNKAPRNIEASGTKDLKVQLYDGRAVLRLLNFTQVEN